MPTKRSHSKGGAGVASRVREAVTGRLVRRGSERRRSASGLVERLKPRRASKRR